MNRRRTPVLILLAVAMLLSLGFAPTSASGDLDVIVVLDQDHPGARGSAQAVAAEHEVEPTHVYAHALDGFAASVTPGRLQALERDPRVRYVEADAEVAAAGQVVPTGVQRVNADDNPAIPTDGTSGTLGVDADIAVLDTGIDASHPDLNVVSSTVCAAVLRGRPADRGMSCEPGGTDLNGHGTLVAGVAGARDNGDGVVGVAPGARLWSVKVLDDVGSGTTSAVVAGIDHVTAHADRIDVANLSLVGDASAAMDQAISTSVAAGVTYVLAAGNQGTDVANVAPAGHPGALTVSALVDFDGEPGGDGANDCGYPWDDGDDTFASFGNYGAGVDMIAPGACILSTRPGGLGMVDGTSFAAPHVAGGAAILASRGLGVDAIHSTLLAQGSQDWLTETSPDGTPYPLLDVGDPDVFAPGMVDEGADPPPAEEADVTLTGEAVRGTGGQWHAQVTATTSDPALEGAEVVISSQTPRGVREEVSCTLDGGSCTTSVAVPNRDAWVTFTLLSVDGTAAASDAQVTVTR
jgi:subtilisin family serine protease